MAGFKNFRALRAAQPEGRKFMSIFRKNTSAVSNSLEWADLTRQPGNPAPFYYASTPLVFAPMAQSTHGGIRHGNPVSPAKKHLKALRWWGQANAHMSGLLVDILGYVPFIPEDDPGVEQVIDFTTNAKPARWGDGDNIVAYLEIAAPHSLVANNRAVITYTNSAGVAGRVSNSSPMQVAIPTNGAMRLRSTGADSVSSHLGFFFSLQDNDSGIRSVESFRLDGAGDVGLVTMVFARIVADFPPLPGGINTVLPIQWNETAFGGPGMPHLPVVEDDAYLSMIFNIQTGTLAPLIGQAEFIWST